MACFRVFLVVCCHQALGRLSGSGESNWAPDGEMDTEDWRSFLKVSGRVVTDKHEVNRQDATERAVREDAGLDVRISDDFGSLVQEDAFEAQQRADAEAVVNRAQQQEFNERAAEAARISKAFEAKKAKSAPQREAAHGL